MNVLIANPAFSVGLDGDLQRYKLGSGMRYPWSLLKRKNELPRYAMFPLFLAYSAALARNNGFEVNVIDCVPLNINNSEFISMVKKCNPDVILFEPNAANLEDLMELLNDLRKESAAKFILAGSHVTATAPNLFELYPIFNYAIVGEFEFSFLKLICALRENESIDGIKGIGFRESDGKVKINGRAEPIINLDDLPIPARDLFPAFFNGDMSLYNDGFCQYYPAYHIHTSRGCCFKCSFCDRVQVLFAGSQQRFFSPHRVVDEMIALKKIGAGEIYIDDDNFTSNKLHVHAICNEIKKRELNLRWSAMCDAMSLDLLTLKIMADAGCVGIKFGLDSADAAVLNSINKPLKLKNLENIVSTSKKLNIKTHMSVVFGLPGETKKTLQRTFEYSCKIDVDSIQFSLATPLPGTPMYNELLKKGSLLSTKWSDLDGANRTVIAYSDMSKEYLENFMACSYRNWMRKKLKNPKWIFRQLKYSKRIAQTKGISGIYKRAIRALVLFLGDAKTVNENNSKKIVRF